MTTATRSPETIDGNASGHSTCLSTCRGVRPIATAHSITALATPWMPVMVPRRIGRTAYTVSATSAVRVPMPPMNGSGIRKPNSARLGMVCARLAKRDDRSRQPAGDARRRCRAESPIAAASAVDHTTSMHVLAQPGEELGAMLDEERARAR